MGRRKGSTNKPKNGAENAAVNEGAAKPGHNGGDDAAHDAERQAALLDQHLPAFEAAKRGIESAAAEMRDVKAVAKAAGFTVKQLEDAFLAQTPEGEKKLKKRLDDTIQVMRWMGVDGQYTFIAPSEDRRPAVDVAKAAGQRAGAAGEPCQPPHHHTVPQHDAWIEGWRLGQDALVRSRIKAPPPADPQQQTAAAAAEPAESESGDGEGGENGEDGEDPRPEFMKRREREAATAIEQAAAAARSGEDEI